MPPITSSIHVVTPRIFLRLKPFLTSLPQLSPSAISPRKFVAPTINRRARFCTAAARDNGGRSGAISGPPVMEGEEAATKIDVNPPKGTRDFPPEEMRLRNWLFHNFKEVSRLYGFEEVDFPVLESEALFIRKAGEEIRDQLYCFEDRGNRRVALRPELTPSLARLVIQKGKSAPLPLKWFAVGQCWRYERMTRGRRREHYQWNMDIIGVPEVTVSHAIPICYCCNEDFLIIFATSVMQLSSMSVSFFYINSKINCLLGFFWNRFLLFSY
ncbi:Histidine--tRNA ligase, chloroplastic/mitochondrial [Linum grandiflorum]